MSEDFSLSIPESLRISNITVDTSIVLGRGSYGVVYEAQYYGAKVAVKKLHSIFFEDVSEDENIGILKTWGNELQLMSKILHPNIVQFYGVYNSGNQKSLKLSGNTFIVSELMHKSLRARNLETTKLNYSMIVNILHDIAAGLCYLHERSSPIMHRDLASKNILLTVSGQAKIADLGVAKIISQKKESLTRHPGTDAYMPVEAIAFGDTYDCSIDVYGLGVIGLELAVGRDPEATQCFKMVGANFVPVEETERRKRDFTDLESSNNFYLKEFILRCVDKMESRVTAVTALKLLDDLKKSVHYTLGEETCTSLEKTDTINITDLEKQIAQLIKEKEDLSKENKALQRKQEDEIKKYEKQLKEKNVELENLKKRHLESLAKKQSDHGSSCIPRNAPPPSVSKHYEYNSSLNKPQFTMKPHSPHSSLVIAGGSSQSTLTTYRQPMLGSHQSHSAKGPRPASAIVTGASQPSNRMYLNQRSHSEDDCLSKEMKYPPPLPSEGIPFTVQNVIQSLTQYCAQIDHEFNTLKSANSAAMMASCMKQLKHLMETIQGYLSTIPHNIKENQEVSQLLTQSNKQIQLLKNVRLDTIRSNETEQLSQAARFLAYNL